MRFLSLAEVLELHRRVVAQSPAAPAGSGISARWRELYETLAEKAAALGFSLILNHPFVDGNKRTGHAAMETLS